jgi:hypothetical protein
MKCLAYLFVAALGFLPDVIRASETANARIWCFSLSFQPGQDTFGDTLYLSTISSSQNGELAPTFTYPNGYLLGDVYQSLFLLTPTSIGDINGNLSVQMPAVVDVNGNGFDDFFEVSQGVNPTSTSGTFSTFVSSGTLAVTWSRAAGSKDGTCTMDFMDDTFGDLGTYTATFTLIEYTGPLTYTPGSNTVTGSVNLVQTGNAANQFTGPVQFNKVATNRFNDLILQAGSWTNSSLQSMPFLTDEYFRTAPWTTNYYGEFDFVDGNPSTPEADYVHWELSIDDTNDVNHNGIPDFSDDPPGSSLPRRPSLSLARGSTNFWLTIHGDVGHLHTILQVSNLISTNWVAVTSINLTTDPQTISLPPPAATRSFWRAFAQ